MAVLGIRDERTGDFWQILPFAAPIPAGRVSEAGSYVFELKEVDEAAVADLLVDDAPLEALRATQPGTARWRWSPGFHAGTVEAELRLPGRGSRRFEIVTDPDLRKLTRNDFDSMVREILEDTLDLFAYSSFGKGVDRRVGGPLPEIARLEFLRSRVAELEGAARAIARRPRRVLTADKTVVPYHRAGRATGQEVVRSLRSGRLLSAGSVAARLPAVLKGVVPERVGLRATRRSLDLVEHRQMAACLRAWSAWLEAVAERLHRHSTPDDPDTQRSRHGWAVRCRRLARRLSRLGELEPFAEAGRAGPGLMLSAVFRNDPAYRRFYRLWQDMKLGIAAVFGDFLRMPLARTFELYELWCFLRLVRAAIAEYGTEGLDVQAVFQKTEAGGITLRGGPLPVPVGSGWKLCFQKSYREYWSEPSGRGSFSRVLRPDVAMGQEADSEPAWLIVLDAKYRLADALNQALNSIHTYRDALVQEAQTGPKRIVKAAYLLTPHLPDLDAQQEYTKTAMPGRLFHPAYRRNFRFGAVTLRPGMKEDELRKVLRMIVEDAQS